MSKYLKNAIPVTMNGVSLVFICLGEGGDIDISVNMKNKSMVVTRTTFNDESEDWESVDINSLEEVEEDLSGYNFCNVTSGFCSFSKMSEMFTQRNSASLNYYYI
jgi:hypothetical protein